MESRFYFILLALLFAAPGGFAAVLTFSASAPAPASDAISNFVGAAFDADNIGGSGNNANGGANNGYANDGTTYVANNRAAQGQTFTTGTNPGGYRITSITVQAAGYTNNIASGSNDTAYSLGSTGSTFVVRVGRLSGTTFIPYDVEYAASGGSGNPGTGSSANGSGVFLTFTLKAPFVLQPNTAYAFDIGTPGDYFEMLGISAAAAVATGATIYTSGSAYISGTGGVAAGTITPEAGDRVFQVNLTAYTPVATGTFTHPGLLSTAADFERMRTNVAMGNQPWLAGYQALTSSWMCQTGGWPAHAQATITRSSSLNNSSILYNDEAVAYGSALAWEISGDTRYADQAVTILNAWGYTFTSVAGDTNNALNELYGYQFACAAEIMRTYPGWAAADIAQFQTMIYNVFYPLANYFVEEHFGTAFDHYWANWDLASMNTMYAIGVFCDNPSLTTQAVNYFYDGVGNGCIDRTVNFVFPAYIGQGQEIGRDQGHASLDVAELATLCQMAWNQGTDLFGYENNRVLSLAEYTAMYNLWQDVPFVAYYSSTGGLMTGPNSGSRGATGRPGWATFYNHYVNLKGLAAPYTTTVVNQNGSYWGFNGDSPGWDYLTAALPPIDSGSNPSGLTATVTAQQPVISWWGSAYAGSYNVLRSTTSGTGYTTIASGLTTNTYTDASVQPGMTYYYVVTGSLPGGGVTGLSNEASAAIGVSLYARLKFDATSGATAADSSGNGWNGTLVNGATWAPGAINNAVSLNGASSQYVSLPNGLCNTLSDYTISAWVYINSSTYWGRIFDFGVNTERYVYLSASPLRFAITGCGVYGEEGITAASSLPTGQWEHVAVTQSGSVATLYVNGMVVGQNTNVPYTPGHFPVTTTNNNIGKSQYPGDPYLNGMVDDFRIYNGVLGAADVETLAAYGVAYLKFDETSGATAADSTFNGWNGTLVNGATWTTGTFGNAVSLNSASSQYVSLPTGVVNNLTNATISAWVNLSSANSGAHIFDFGTGTTSYMYLTPNSGTTGVVRFAISTSGSSGEQSINGTAAVPANGWHHVAVTLTGSTGALYVDGVQVGSNSAMTLTPSSLGATTQNWIGQSHNGGDPCLNGAVDDFHIYSIALSAGQVATLCSGLGTPSVTVTAGDTQDVLTWNAVPNASTYLVERSTTSGGPYTIIGTPAGTSYTDGGLTDGATYYYTVIAENGFGVSNGSAQTSGYPVPPPPSAPTGLTSIGSNGTVALAWNASGTATSYNLKRHDTTTTTFTTIATGLTATSYTDTAVTNGATYTYVVSASNLGGEGANSTPSSATPLAPSAQVATSVAIAPTAVTLFDGQSQQFAASAFDQYGQPMQNPQPFTWSLVSGVGSMNPVGLYVAPASGTGGTANVRVNVGAAMAGATVTVYQPVGVFGASSDIGSPALAGSSSVSGSTYTLTGGGSDVWGTSDQFQFAFVPMTGNGTITARVVSQTNTNPWAKAGVMMRNTLLATSAFIDNFVSPSNGIVCQYRSADSATAATLVSGTPGITAPYWVQLTRAGNNFTASMSPDGVAWTQLGVQTIAMNSTIYVGLMDCSHNNGALCTAVFDNVSVVQQGGHNIFPYDTDIGASAPGSYVESGSTVTMTAQGGDIWGTSDGLHFGYNGIVGNGSITARVVSMTDTASTCKAGVMIRNSIAGNSVEVNNSMQYSYGVNFQGRTSTGASSTSFGAVTGASVVPPYWVQLTRSGNTFTAQCASDVSGTPGTWTQVGSAQTISAAQGTMLFGLDVSSVNTSELCTAVFDNITVTGTVDTPPTIVSQPAVSINGLSAALSVLGADDGGESSLTYTWSVLGVPLGNVVFSDNGTNTAKNTTVTFSASGNYYLQATVTDVTGLTVSSNIIQVVAGTVTAPFAPAGLTATGSNAVVMLNWGASNGATSYNVQRSATSGTGYVTVATVTSGTSYSDSGVTNGTTYYYVVTASNPAGTSAFSTQASATPVAPPSAPTGVTATGSNAVVMLNWSASNGAASYNVQRSVTSGSGYATVATVTGSTSYSDTTVTNGTAYYYVVSASNPGGTSANSAEASATPVAPPSAPAGLKATGSNGVVALSWTASSGATSYNVQRSVTGGSGYAAVASVLGTTAYTDTGLTNGTTYYYVVSASNPGGTSANSAQASATPRNATSGVYLRFDETGGTTAADSTGGGWNGTLVNGPAFVAGRINNAVGLTGSSGQYVTLPTSVVAGLTNFTAAAWVNMTSMASWMRVFDFGTGTTAYMFLTPANGQTGHVRFSITASGNGNEQQINTNVVVATGTWTHIAVTLSGSLGTLYVNGTSAGTNTAMTLNPSSLGATTNNYIGKSQFSGSAGTDPYLNGVVDEFHVYNYALTAAQIAQLASPPAAPAGVAIAPGNAQAVLTWNAATGAAGYNSKRSITSGSGYATVASVTTTSDTDTGLVNGTPYYYVVTTVEGVAESANSSQVSTTPVTPPLAPTGLTATGSNGVVALSWNPSSGATGYNVKRTVTSGTGYAVIAAGLSASPYYDTSVANETTYYYVVSALNGGGDGANSLEASARPYLPIAPGELVAPAISIISGTGGNILSLTVRTVAGRTYQLQWTESLISPSWQNVGSAFTGTGQPVDLRNLVDPAVPSSFYRILIQP